MYWEQRKAALLKETTTKENQTLKKLEKALKSELDALTKSIEKYYNRYGADNVFQYERLLETSTEAERFELYAKTKQFMAKHPESAFLTDIRNSYYKLQRMDLLQANIKLSLYEIAELENKLLPKTLKEVYVNGYKKTLYNEAMYYGVETFHAGFNTQVLQRTLQTEWVNGGNFSKRIWKNKKRLVDMLTNDFAMMVSRGDNIQSITEVFKQSFQTSYNDARRLVQTESAFVLEQGTLEAYKENGTEEYRFMSTLDSVTSKTCRKLDNKVYKLIDAEVGVNYPPMHPHCRSTTVNAASKLKTRGMRTAKGYERIPYMDYAEWEQKYYQAS
ncbi:minor capsid protein [Listeria sp. SHR_NRA_18]|uniref:minor capsid protein n=1 Tax=Listeria sp. SHR_NRA_18 TaxID=2269046 RepID=UPI001374ECB6|nr:minor capsid protein [Listeria sp. SHR_NRA_18]